MTPRKARKSCNKVKHENGHSRKSFFQVIILGKDGGVVHVGEIGYVTVMVGQSR